MAETASAAAPAATLEGKWTLVKSENFDEYLKALGLGFLMRKAAAAAKPTQEISFQDSCTRCVILTATSIKNLELRGPLGGEEFDEQTADGRAVKSTLVLEDSGRRLVHSQRGSGGAEAPPLVSVRQLQPDDGNILVMTLSFKGVSAKRFYQRV